MTRRICVLVFPDFQLLDAAGPIAAFESAGAYKVRTVPSGLLGAQFLGRSLGRARTAARPIGRHAAGERRLGMVHGS
jgi:transcriptional regulator GlxA family with amidase domain